MKHTSDNGSPSDSMFRYNVTDRRTVLSSVAASAATLIAGCSSSDGNGNQTSGDNENDGQQQAASFEVNEEIDASPIAVAATIEPVSDEDSAGSDMTVDEILTNPAESVTVGVEDSYVAHYVVGNRGGATGTIETSLEFTLERSGASETEAAVDVELPQLESGETAVVSSDPVTITTAGPRTPSSPADITEAFSATEFNPDPKQIFLGDQFGDIEFEVAGTTVTRNLVLPLNQSPPPATYNGETFESGFGSSYTASSYSAPNSDTVFVLVDLEIQNRPGARDMDLSRSLFTPAVGTPSEYIEAADEQGNGNVPRFTRGFPGDLDRALYTSDPSGNLEEVMTLVYEVPESAVGEFELGVSLQHDDVVDLIYSPFEDDPTVGSLTLEDVQISADNDLTITVANGGSIDKSLFGIVQADGGSVDGTDADWVVPFESITRIGSTPETQIVTIEERIPAGETVTIEYTRHTDAEYDGTYRVMPFGETINT